MPKYTLPNPLLLVMEHSRLRWAASIPVQLGSILRSNQRTDAQYCYKKSNYSIKYI